MSAFCDFSRPCVPDFGVLETIGTVLSEVLFGHVTACEKKRHCYKPGPNEFEHVWVRSDKLGDPFPEKVCAISETEQ